MLQRSIFLKEQARAQLALHEGAVRLWSKVGFDLETSARARDDAGGPDESQALRTHPTRCRCLPRRVFSRRRSGRLPPSRRDAGGALVPGPASPPPRPAAVRRTASPGRWPRRRPRRPGRPRSFVLRGVGSHRSQQRGFEGDGETRSRTNVLIQPYRYHTHNALHPHPNLSIITQRWTCWRFLKT